MKVLLDTHALIWWFEDSPSLGRAARDAMTAANNIVIVSAVSAIEVTTKVRIGKLPSAAVLAAEFIERCLGEGFDLLPVSVKHAALAGQLAIPHGDPFDRLLIAQSQIENVPLISNERRFDAWGVRRLW